MASYTAVLSAHHTLVAATLDTVTLSGTFSGSPIGRVEVYNHDATAVIYCRADGTAAVSAADGTFSVGPGMARIISTTQNLTGTAASATEAVTLISAGTPAYSVTAVG